MVFSLYLDLKICIFVGKFNESLKYICVWICICIENEDDVLIILSVMIYVFNGPAYICLLWIVFVCQAIKFDQLGGLLHNQNKQKIYIYIYLYLCNDIEKSFKFLYFTANL